MDPFAGKDREREKKKLSLSSSQAGGSGRTDPPWMRKEEALLVFPLLRSFLFSAVCPPLLIDIPHRPG